MLLIFNFLYIMFVFLFLCIYTNPATGCYMNKTILCCVDCGLLMSTSIATNYSTGCKVAKLCPVYRKQLNDNERFRDKINGTDECSNNWY